MDMGSDEPAAPAVDPRVGEAAVTNAETAKILSQVGIDTLAWNKERWNELKPTIVRAAQQQLAAGDLSLKQGEGQWDRYLKFFAPAEEQYAEEVKNFDGSGERQAAEARADVDREFEQQRGTSARDLARAGVNINPGSESSIARRVESGNVQAAAGAGASNTARTNAKMQKIALTQGVAQFGRNMPQTGIAATGMGVGATSAGVGTINTQTGAYNSGVGSAMPWFNSAVGANTASGNLLLGQYGAQMQGYNANQQAQGSMFGGLGQLAGTVIGGIYGGPRGAATGGAIGGAVGNMAVAKGGIIKYRGVVRRGYAGGGVVRGPGDGSVDTVPAVVDGQRPAALANGEGVLNAPATKLVGEDFVHRVNKIGLMLKAIMENGVAGAQGVPA